MCKTTSLIIANGRIHNDNNVGGFTFINTNGSSTVDYLLLSPTDFSLLKCFKILDPNEFSDHSGIEISIKTKSERHSKSKHQLTTTMDSYLCWSKDNISSFRDLLTNSYHTLETMTNDLNNSTIEHSIKAFTNYIHNHAFSEFSKTRTINKHV